MPPSAFEREVLAQPRALRNLIETYAGEDSPLEEVAAPGTGKTPAILFVGMGSSLFATYPAAYRLTADGVQAHCADASEYLHYGLGQPSGTFLPVLVSQSGESPEIKRILRKWKDRPPPVAITNDREGALARAASVVLPLFAGPEAGTTSKTYTNTIAAALLLAARLVGRDVKRLLRLMALLPDVMDDMLQDWREDLELVAGFIGDAPHLDLIGRGPSLATLGQGSLILRELAHVKTAGISAGLFRHGMIPSMKGGGTAIVFAPEGPTTELTLALMEEIVARGGRCVIVTEREVPLGPGKIAYRLPSVPGSRDFRIPFLEIVFVELLGLVLAERRGMQPGEGIEKITTRE